MTLVHVLILFSFQTFAFRSRDLPETSCTTMAGVWPNAWAETEPSKTEQGSAPGVLLKREFCCCCFESYEGNSNAPLDLFFCLFSVPLSYKLAAVYSVAAPTAVRCYIVVTQLYWPLWDVDTSGPKKKSVCVCVCITLRDTCSTCVDICRLCVIEQWLYVISVFFLSGREPVVEDSRSERVVVERRCYTRTYY